MAALQRLEADGSFIIWSYKPVWEGQEEGMMDSALPMYKFAAVEDIVGTAGKSRYVNYFLKSFKSHGGTRYNSL